MSTAVAMVAVEKAAYFYDKLYAYAIPAGTRVVPGVRVTVPFGRGSRKVTGFVFAVEELPQIPEAHDSDSGDKPLKKIEGVLDAEPCLNDEMLALAAWLKENTFCTYYTAALCILPPVLRNTPDSPAPEQSRGKRGKPHSERLVRLNAEVLENFGGELTPLKLTPKQKSVISVLENTAATIKELVYLCGVTSSVVTNLVAKGILAESLCGEEIESAMLPESESPKIIPRKPEDIRLTDSQREVFLRLMDLLHSGEPKCGLLHGVTGSGKTSVFIRVVGEALAAGRTAMILVPEISLTPQTIAIFKGFFGDNAAVIHSGLSMSKRTEEYNRIRSGRAKIVIGTRSAVFAPLENIGVIVIDEEGEHTYKSERSPRYHVRDIAKQRCFRHNALLLLASATPSMDSYRRAELGKYTLLELNERYSGNPLPAVYIVDMKLEQVLLSEQAGRDVPAPTFSRALLRQIEENLGKGEQTLILLNRRGFNTFICCIRCGEVEMCPNCGVPLTRHSDSRAAAQTLRCHYCGYSRRFSDRCGKCGSVFIRQTGTGTQRVEAELGELFPQARILRMDADTTGSRGAYERGFKAFGNGEYDILVGTQMIAKGLDFPNVTLVGILLIDNSLYAGDYVGYERTFALITQVVGRSGRGAPAGRPPAAGVESGQTVGGDGQSRANTSKGRAYLQTFTPDHYVLRLAARQDYRGFYHEEAAIRQALLFPPFCDVCVVEFCAAVECAAAQSAFAFVELFEGELRRTGSMLPVRALGPVRSGNGSINGRFRYRLLVKCRNSPKFRAIMSAALTSAGMDRRFDSCRVSAWFD